MIILGTLLIRYKNQSQHSTEMIRLMPRRLVLEASVKDEADFDLRGMRWIQCGDYGPFHV